RDRGARSPVGQAAGQLRAARLRASAARGDRSGAAFGPGLGAAGTLRPGAGAPPRRTRARLTVRMALSASCCWGVFDGPRCDPSTDWLRAFRATCPLGVVGPARSELTGLIRSLTASVAALACPVTVLP